MTTVQDTRPPHPFPSSLNPPTTPLSYSIPPGPLLGVNKHLEPLPGPAAVVAVAAAGGSHSESPAFTHTCSRWCAGGGDDGDSGGSDGPFVVAWAATWGAALSSSRCRYPLVGSVHALLPPTPLIQYWSAPNPIGLSPTRAPTRSPTYTNCSQCLPMYTLHGLLTHWAISSPIAHGTTPISLALGVTDW